MIYLPVGRGFSNPSSASGSDASWHAAGQRDYRPTYGGSAALEETSCRFHGMELIAVAIKSSLRKVAAARG